MKDENDRRNYFMVNLHKVWDWVGIELAKEPGTCATLAEGQSSPLTLIPRVVVSLDKIYLESI